MSRTCCAILVGILVVGVHAPSTGQGVAMEWAGRPGGATARAESVPNLEGEWDMTLCWEGGGCASGPIYIEQTERFITIYEWEVEFWVPVGWGLTTGRLVAFRIGYGCRPTYMGRPVGPEGDVLLGVMRGAGCQGYWYATRATEEEKTSDRRSLGGPSGF